MRDGVLLGILGLGLMLAGCGSPSRSENLNSIVWVRTSAEYPVATRQVYSSARGNLARALFEPEWNALRDAPMCDGCPPAVILDLDETVLDNSGYDALLLTRGESFNWETWRAWLANDRAEAVPGAVEFVRAARAAGVKVIYLTNRREHFRASTTANLARLGMAPESPEELLMREEAPKGDKDKTARRRWVAERYRVLLLIGDDLNDFVFAAERSPEERRALAAEYAERWGNEWLLVPSPVYGGWLEAVTGDATDASARHAAKVRALEE